MKTYYKDVLRFFTRYIVPTLSAHKAQVVISILLLFLSTGLLILAMELSRLLIQGIQQTLGQHWLVEQLGIFPIDSSPTVILAEIGFLCVLVFSIASLVSYYRDIHFEEIALRLTVSLRKKLFEHLLKTRVSFFKNYESSVLVKRMIADLANIRMILVEALMLRSADALLFIGLLFYMLSLNGFLTAISLGLVALYFAIAEISARWIGPGLHRSDLSSENMTSHLNQSFQRVLDIKSNQRESHEKQSFDELAESDYRIRKKTISFLMLDRSVTGWLSFILPILVTIAGGFFVLNNTMRLDQVLVFVAVINMLTNSVDKLTEIPMIISRTHVSVRNVDELFSLPEEIVSNETRELAGIPEHKNNSPAILIKEFSRPLSENHILEIDHLEIKQGEKIAVIGPSGCGKSCLFSSILKFDEEYSGFIKIFGLEVLESGVNTVRSNIAYMHQHSMVLPNNIESNIIYSRLDTPVDNDLIKNILNTVELGELLDLQEGERDPAVLSGGQKRRLCLARALYRNSPLLLLDEPLTGVSPSVSRNIIRQLVLRSETLVMVTHQYEDLDRFDRVILMNIKETASERITFIEAQGTHETLMKENENYRKVLANAS